MQPTDMEQIYQKLDPDQIPWDSEQPPKLLIDLVESGTVKPCKTVDLGCGTGQYSIYLTEQGFDVTGIDISTTAVRYAQENAAKKDVECTFISADLTEDTPCDAGSFDFAFDYELLHHIFPDRRSAYVQNVNRLLKPGGKYLSVCFSEVSSQFGGTGKYRETPIGTLLYFSSEDEIRSLVEPYFNIHELKTVEVVGKFAPHQAVYAWMEKK
ncbi:MAG: class I SAM-dependent methyltransferase [bacterium]